MRPITGTITDPVATKAAGLDGQHVRTNEVRLSQRESAYLIQAVLNHGSTHPVEFLDRLVEKLWDAYR